MEIARKRAENDSKFRESQMAELYLRSKYVAALFRLLDYSGTFKQQVYRSRGRGEFPDHRAI